jgi:pyridoxal phosphate-dependent aminotransferase EpsN
MKPEKKRIYLSPPHMGGREMDFVKDAFDSNWLSPLGPNVDAFETEFAAKVGRSHAAALSSGTAALHLGLRLLQIRPGDAVITSSLTFCASANPILYEGAEPIFVDAEAESWNLDPKRVEEAIADLKKEGRRVAALVGVDLYGQCADWKSLEALCQAHEIPIIEDAAESLGARRGEKPAGSFGRLAIFSFNGNKIITTSGGGMLAADDEELVKKARFLASQARDPAPHYQHSQLGFNYRMSNVLAGMGRGQLLVLEERVDQRRAVFANYEEALGDEPGIAFMPEPQDAESTRWLTVMLIDDVEFGAGPETIRLALEAENIEARPVWKPLHLQPLFAGARVYGGAISEDLFARGLCLPSGSALSPQDQARIVSIIRDVGKKARGGA